MPKTVSEGGNNYNTDTIGKTKETILLSAKDKNNEMAWEMMNKEFFKEGATFDSTHNFFKKFHDDNKKLKEGRKDLRARCREAYDKESTGTPSDTLPSPNETIKYCTLKGAE